MKITPDKFIELAKMCYDVNEQKGWHESDKDFYTQLNLIVSELYEAFESYRNNEPYFWHRNDGKPEGMAIELVDAVIRIMDILVSNINITELRIYFVDMEALASTEPDYTSKENANDFNLEILNLTKSILVSSYYYELIQDVVYLIKYLEFNGFDVEQLIRVKMTYNKTRSYKHGNKRF